MEKIIKEHNTQQMYDKMLRELVPNLERLSFLSGVEGKVYFVNDDFVVKEYYNPYINEKIFEGYLKEIKSFSESGLSVPKIYAASKLESPNHIKPHYYLLEERVKGKKLYNDITGIYPRVKEKMSSKQFNDVIFQREKYPEQYSEVLIEYLSDIKERCEQVLNMSEKNINDFILSLFNFYISSHYSYPDVHQDNVLFDGEKFTFIDQGLSIAYHQSASEKIAKGMIMFDLYCVFDGFFDINSMKALDIKFKPRVEKLKSTLEQYKYDIALKFCKKTKSLLKPMKASDFLSSTQRFLDENKAKIIVEELEKI